MAPRIGIARFRARDMRRIEQIEAASFGQDAYDRNLFADLFHKCGDLFLVAERASGVCGYMITCVRGEQAEVVSIAVDPKARAKGVGSALLESTLRRLRRRGIERVTLMVKVTNGSARRFYEKYGFRKARLVRGYYEDGSDGIRMWLDLTLR